MNYYFFILSNHPACEVSYSEHSSHIIQKKETISQSLFRVVSKPSIASNQLCVDYCVLLLSEEIVPALPVIYPTLKRRIFVRQNLPSILAQTDLLWDRSKSEEAESSGWNLRKSSCHFKSFNT